MDINAYNILGDKTGIITHEFINRMLFEHVPHEWYFLNLLYKEEIKKNKNIAYIFSRFVETFYPDYKYEVPIDDVLARVVCESSVHDYRFMLVHRFRMKPNTTLDKSMEFGEIVTDFLIRYCNYSLVDFSGDKIILTAQSDIEKRFSEYIEYGFKFHRVSKLYYENDTFYKLPVLPSKESWLNIDEVIEGSDGIYRQIPIGKRL